MCSNQGSQVMTHFEEIGVLNCGVIYGKDRTNPQNSSCRSKSKFGQKLGWGLVADLHLGPSSMSFGWRIFPVVQQVVLVPVTIEKMHLSPAGLRMIQAQQIVRMISQEHYERAREVVRRILFHPRQKADEELSRRENQSLAIDWVY